MFITISSSINRKGEYKFMKLSERKKQIKNKITAMGMAFYLIAIKSSTCYATGGIGTAEVQTATENIKRVITSIAMPLGRSPNFCKYCSSSN